jgi:hypothetical protein
MALPDFQQYQLQFAGHIRNPAEKPKPAKVPARRMRVYTQIVFNNLESSVSACFPICRKILGVRAWKRLVRAFFMQHQCSSPLFRKIPEEFLQFLKAVQHVPPYLYSLAHYEWVELAVSVDDAEVDAGQVDPAGELLDSEPVFAPAMALLSYDYPVHQISSRNQSTAPLAQPVHLLVYRNVEDEVRFVELNPVTAQLLNILQSGTFTCRQALEQVAVELKHPDPEAIVRFGLGILEDLRQQGVILGSKR